MGYQLSEEQAAWVRYMGFRASFGPVDFWLMVAAAKVLAFAGGCDGLLLGGVKTATLLSVINMTERLLSTLLLPVTGAMVDYTDRRLQLVKVGLCMTIVGVLGALVLGPATWQIVAVLIVVTQPVSAGPPSLFLPLVNLLPFLVNPFGSDNRSFFANLILFGSFY